MKRRGIYCAAALTALTLSMTACNDGSNYMSLASIEATDINEISMEVAGEEETSVATQEEQTQEKPQQEESVTSETEVDLEPEMTSEAETASKPEETVEEEMSSEELIDLTKADDAVKEQGSLMLQNLELEEYLDESVNLISTDEWFHTMMNGATEGSRNYDMQRDGNTILTIQVGYEEAGEVYAKVSYFGEQVRVLERNGNAVQMLTTQMTDGVYEGDFEIWNCDGNTGDIYHATGTFSNGVQTGDYTVEYHKGTAASDIYALWSHKEGMEYTTHTENMDGQTATEESDNGDNISEEWTQDIL